jgi:ribose 5-phosphate isomerase A
VSSTADESKRSAAKAALSYVREATYIGVGTGSTVNFFIAELQAHSVRIKGAVSSSNATSARLRAAGIDVIDLNDAGPLDIYIDGADEATRRRELIKGGGGALTREKIVAAAASRFVCIVDAGKLVDELGKFPLPIEVIPMARSSVAREMASLGGRAVLRADFITDNGNIILDVHGLAIRDPVALERAINQIAGVVTVGLFAVRPADVLLIGSAQGVETL